LNVEKNYRSSKTDIKHKTKQKNIKIMVCNGDLNNVKALVLEGRG
jgi:hypothetical protein